MFQTTADRNSSASGEEWVKALLSFYKGLVSISYLSLVITTLYFVFNQAEDCSDLSCRFWRHQTQTLFAQSSIATSFYWAVLFVFQVAYVCASWMSNDVYRTTAANLSGHYILSNFLLLSFVHLWMHEKFWLAECSLVLNFFNLLFAYFYNPATPSVIHIGTVAGPLAWNFAALYWVGATAANSMKPIAQAAANVSIWGWLACGVFFLAAYDDYIFGLGLSFLSLSTALGQSSSRTSASRLQWIFAVTTASILVALSSAIALLRSIRNYRHWGRNADRRGSEKKILVADGSLFG